MLLAFHCAQIFVFPPTLNIYFHGLEVVAMVTHIVVAHPLLIFNFNFGKFIISGNMNILHSLSNLKKKKNFFLKAPTSQSHPLRVRWCPNLPVC